MYKQQALFVSVAQCSVFVQCSVCMQCSVLASASCPQNLTCETSCRLQSCTRKIASADLQHLTSVTGQAWLLCGSQRFFFCCSIGLCGVCACVCVCMRCSQSWVILKIMVFNILKRLYSQYDQIVNIIVIQLLFLVSVQQVQEAQPPVIFILTIVLPIRYYCGSIVSSIRYIVQFNITIYSNIEIFPSTQCCVSFTEGYSVRE